MEKLAYQLTYFHILVQNLCSDCLANKFPNIIFWCEIRYLSVKSKVLFL